MLENLKLSERYDGFLFLAETVRNPPVLRSHRHVDLVKRTMDTLMVGSLDSDVLNREAGFGVASGFSFEHSDPDALNAGLRHLLLLCWRCHRAGGSSDAAVALHPAVLEVLRVLGKGDWEGGLAGLARHCGVSEAYLSRVFARQMGLSLGRYRNLVRLGRFLELCRQPEHKTMLEAAYATGFGSYAQFYKVFVQAYGMGPGATMKRRV